LPPPASAPTSTIAGLPLAVAPNAAASSSSNAGYPPPPRARAAKFIDAEHAAADHVVLGVCHYDPVTQVLDNNHVRIDASGIFLQPISLRLARAPELGLMARIAGLRLRERWGGWNSETYTAASWRHVSGYEPAPGQ
jgi:hypothetical protein